MSFPSKQALLRSFQMAQQMEATPWTLTFLLEESGKILGSSLGTN
jgi:hypothetical protein